MLVLCQFFAPVFFPVLGQDAINTRETSYHTQHSSATLPILLKEKDEKEYEELSSDSSLILILDFATHSFNLTATHKRKIDYAHSNLRYDLQPALFTRHCSFLI
jgi:hypothetical protein